MSDTSSALSKAVLLADGLGCAAAAAAVSMHRVYRIVDPELTAQSAVRTGLLVTSGVCIFGAVTNPCRALRSAAVINAGWVGVCLSSLKHQHTVLGRVLVGATAVFDAAAGYAQWRLSAGLRTDRGGPIPRR